MVVFVGVGVWVTSGMRALRHVDDFSRHPGVPGMLSPALCPQVLPSLF